MIYGVQKLRHLLIDGNCIPFLLWKKNTVLLLPVERVGLNTPVYVEGPFFLYFWLAWCSFSTRYIPNVWIARSVGGRWEVKKRCGGHDCADSCITKRQKDACHGGCLLSLHLSLSLCSSIVVAAFIIISSDALFLSSFPTWVEIIETTKTNGYSFFDLICATHCRLGRTDFLFDSSVCVCPGLLWRPSVMHLIPPTTGEFNVSKIDIDTQTQYPSALCSLVFPPWAQVTFYTAVWRHTGCPL